MENNIPILKARSPAALAEEYIVKSIWDNQFPPGSDLPAERDLADKIGVTRTTLREVLQRLARDGWLHIQHGKPTRVNNIWETAGLNIIDTLVKLDGAGVPALVANILSARTNIGSIYIRIAFKTAPEQSLELFQKLDQLEDSVEAYTIFDYQLFSKLAFISRNPIYGLVFNSLRNLYTRVGAFYFQYPASRTLAMAFYRELEELCRTGRYDEVPQALRTYGYKSGEIWYKLQEHLLEYLEQ